MGGKMKRITAIGIGLFLIFIALASVGQAANTPYTIYGRVTSSGIGVNGAQVTIYNSDTHESISYAGYETLTTWTGLSGNGYYSANIGNMPTAWSRGDVVYVNVTYGSESVSQQFTIPEFDYIYELDIGFGITPGDETTNEGQYTWRGIPSFQQLVTWLQHIDLVDLAIALSIALLISWLFVVAFGKRRRKRRPIIIRRRI
jgi:hypothetical protein